MTGDAAERRIANGFKRATHCTEHGHPLREGPLNLKICDDCTGLVLAQIKTRMSRG